MHQHDDQACTWTRAAYSLQVSMDRARYTAENAAKFAPMIDSAFTGSQGVAAELVGEWTRIERDLSLIQDLAILAAQNPDFAKKLEALVDEAKRGSPLPGDVQPAARRHRETRSGVLSFGTGRPLQELLRVATSA